MATISIGWAKVPSFSNSALNNESAFTVTGKIASPPVTYDTSSFPATFQTQTTLLFASDRRWRRCRA